MKYKNPCVGKTVSITDEEIEAIQKKFPFFKNFYRVRVTGAKVLNWKPNGSYECIFFDKEKCILKDLKPNVCKEEEDVN